MKRVIVAALLAAMLSLAASAQDRASGVAAPFLMGIEDSFEIPGSGPVVLGTIERGRVNKGDHLELVGGTTATKIVTVASIIASGDTMPSADAGQRVQIGIKGASLKDIGRGKALADPHSIKAYARFRAQVYMLDTSNGGRRSPANVGYAPLFIFRSTGFSGAVKEIANKGSLSPGDRGVEIIVELETPIALEKGTTFSIKEDGHNVGSGTVISLDQ